MVYEWNEHSSLDSDLTYLFRDLCTTSLLSVDWPLTLNVCIKLQSLTLIAYNDSQAACRPWRIHCIFMTIYCSNVEDNRRLQTHPSIPRHLTSKDQFQGFPPYAASTTAAASPTTTSSTKPEVHIAYCRQRRIEVWACSFRVMRADRHTDRHTDMLITVLCTPRPRPKYCVKSAWWERVCSYEVLCHISPP